jgi:tartronate-semialdehyde synthase
LCSRSNRLISRHFRRSFRIAGNKFNFIEIARLPPDDRTRRNQENAKWLRCGQSTRPCLEKEGVTCAFGVPGAAINPLYSALKKRGSISHILARHVEGASHMAEGFSRAKAGNIGVCIGTSGPAGTDMITGLYSAIADSIPILCITGQAPAPALQGISRPSISNRSPSP